MSRALRWGWFSFEELMAKERDVREREGDGEGQLHRLIDPN